MVQIPLLLISVPINLQ